MEENNLLTELYQIVKKELQSVIMQLKEQIENLKAENAGIPVLKTRLKEPTNTQTLSKPSHPELLEC
jgi:hypothetical protein